MFTVSHTGFVSTIAMLCLVALCPALAAQAPTPSFDVASVRRNLSEPLEKNWSVLPGGRFTATNQTVADLIQFAYDIDDTQLIGGPSWVREYRFEIDAKATGQASTEQVRLMMQMLLKDRFRLTIRREQREVTVQEQLGLRLDRKGPVDVLFIDSIQQPTEN